MIPVLKRFSLLLITVAGCWSVCLSQGKILVPSADSNDWKEFSSPEGRFSVLLPGTPIAKTNELQTSAGRMIDYVFTLKLAESFYQVSYLDYLNYSDDEEFARKALDAGRDGMVARNKGTKILGEKQITISGFPGREFLILQDQFSFGIMRTLIVHGRIYEVAMLVLTDIAFKKGRPSLQTEDRTDLFQSISNRFFDSFKLIDSVQTLGEVDRMLRDLKTQHKGVVTMVGSAADPSDPNLIRGGVINGKAVHLVTPVYPAIAHASHAAGEVQVQVLIGTEGNVIAAQVISGHPLLRAAAIKAARESKFTPTLLEGKPVIVNGIIIYNFVSQ
jgi:TonB family protein